MKQVSAKMIFFVYDLPRFSREMNGHSLPSFLIDRLTD